MTLSKAIANLVNKWIVEDDVGLEVEADLPEGSLQSIASSQSGDTVLLTVSINDNERRFTIEVREIEEA
jgi:hypothetical protein